MLYAIGFVAVLMLIVVRTIPTYVEFIDGDTITVRGRRWRLGGYDAPEADQPGGTEATRRLQQILDQGRMIGIVTGIDPYGRLLVHVVTTRGLLSHRMCWSGHAHGEGVVGRLLAFTARMLGRGIWNGSHAVVTPRRWRDAHPRKGARQHAPRARRSSFRMPRMGQSYGRDGLRLPGGFRIP